LLTLNKASASRIKCERDRLILSFWLSSQRSQLSRQTLASPALLFQSLLRLFSSPALSFGHVLRLNSRLSFLLQRPH
jgi:hypothetical protein